MIYKLIYPNKSCQRHIEKFLNGLGEDAKEKVLDAVFALKNNPRPHGYIHLKPPTKVFSYLADYRVAVHNFRIFYDIDDKFHRVILYQSDCETKELTSKPPVNSGGLFRFVA